MNVVLRIGRALGQTRHWSPLQILLVVGWILALVAIEIRGRSSMSDLADALALLELLFVLFLSLALDYDATSGVVKRLWRGLREKATALFAKRLVLGLDLRLSPPIKSALPRRWQVSLAVLIVLNLAALAASPYLPVLLRASLHGVFYLGYLWLLFGLWLTVSLSIFITGFIAWGSVHDYFVTRYQGNGPRNRRAESLCMMSGVGAILLAIVMLPAWLPFALLAASLLIWTCGFFGYREGFQLLWKRRNTDNVFAVDGCFATWLSCVAPALLISFLMLLTRGHVLTSNEIITPAMLTMPLTSALGVILSWTIVAAMTTKAFTAMRLLLVRRGMSLRMAPLHVLHVAGATRRDERHAVRAAALATGWRVRFGPQPARQTDVCVRLCEHPAEQAAGWPLPVTLPSLATAQIQSLLKRRDEIQSRRLLLNGLQRILKRAARISDRSGTGWMIGAQHWFILGVSRDKESDFTQDAEATAIDMIAGPPFHAVIPLHARRHFREILLALAIDMIFVEDGVSFRRLVRVLRVAFEIYDMHGGQRRAEERDFNGLPGVRVMLHDFSIIETTHQVERGYPEPDYEDFGRARFLHVFKDRGAHEEWTPSPWETDDVPLLSGW